MICSRFAPGANQEAALGSIPGGGGVGDQNDRGQEGDESYLVARQSKIMNILWSSSRLCYTVPTLFPQCQIRLVPPGAEFR